MLAALLANPVVSAVESKPSSAGHRPWWEDIEWFDDPILEEIADEIEIIREALVEAEPYLPDTTLDVFKRQLIAIARQVADLQRRLSETFEPPNLARAYHRIQTRLEDLGQRVAEAVRDEIDEAPETLDALARRLLGDIDRPRRRYRLRPPDNRLRKIKWRN